MGARWRLATVAVLAIVACALIVVVADDEHTGQIADAVRISVDSVKQSANNWRLWRGRKQTIRRSAEASFRPTGEDDLLGGSKAEGHRASLSSREQAEILSELADQKRKLKAVLRGDRDRYAGTSMESEEEGGTGSAVEDILTEEEESPNVEDILTDEEESPNGSQEEAYEKLLRQVVAEGRAEKHKSEAYRKAVELDEEELEQEAVEGFRRDMQKRLEAQQAKARQHMVDQNMWHDKAQDTGKDVAKSTVKDVAKSTVKDVAMSTADQAARELHAEAESDIVPLESSLRHPKSQSQDDLNAMSDRIAKLKAKLDAVQTTSKLAKTNDPSRSTVAPVDDNTVESLDDDNVVNGDFDQEEIATEPEEVSEDVTPLVMESDSPQRTSRSRASPVPAEAPSTDGDGGEDILHLKKQKPLDEPVRVESEAPKEATPADVIEEEGGETETEAGYSILTYLMWSSVGALVIGILGTVVYCACQTPRDRPWNLPPRRYK